VTSRAVALVPVAVLLAQLAAAPAGAVVGRAQVEGGAADGAAHPYVVALVRPGGTATACSGVWVRSDYGARAVLTAAHCLYDGHRSGSGWMAVFGEVADPAAPRWSGSWVVSPSYAPSSSYRHDWGVLVLSALPPVRSAVLASVGRQDRTPQGAVTTVGFGSPSTGHRRSATEVVTGRDAAWLYLRRGTGNSCAGDSGGPDLVRGTDTVLALTDQGSCTRDQDLRVDTAEVHDAVVQVTRALRPVARTHPSAQAVAEGATATFQASASGAPSAVSWQSSRDRGATWTDLPGAGAATLSLRATRDLDSSRYRAVFRSSAGVATTRSALLAVAPAA
jgi:hypothetical protein